MPADHGFGFWAGGVSQPSVSGLNICLIGMWRGCATSEGSRIHPRYGDAPPADDDRRETHHASSPAEAAIPADARVCRAWVLAHGSAANDPPARRPDRGRMPQRHR
jgi:hypothetical protein